MRSPLERREARVGYSYVLFVAALFLPSVGTCGGIGAFKAHLASSSIVPTAIDDVADESRTPAGTYVETTANLRFVARDQLPFDAERVVKARGGTLYSVVGKASVVVYCEDSACAGLEERAAPIRLRGQVCNGDERLRCEVPEGLDLYLRREAHLGRPHRVLLAGLTPAAQLWEAVVGISIALMMLFGGAGLLLAATRPRRSAHLFVERSVTLRGTKETARAALQMREGTTFRLAGEGADHLIFLAGAQASRARLKGVKSPDDVARRVEIRFQDQAAYRSVLMTVTVTEILPFARGVPKPLQPMVQAALALTLAEVEQLVA